MVLMTMAMDRECKNKSKDACAGAGLKKRFSFSLTRVISVPCSLMTANNLCFNPNRLLRPPSAAKKLSFGVQPIPGWVRVCPCVPQGLEEVAKHV